MSLEREEPASAEPAAENGPEPAVRWGAELWDWFRITSIALAAVVALNVYVFNLSAVKGHSMEPTLQEKEWLFVNKWAYRIGTPKRGDVVILRDPYVAGEKSQFLVKRVVALPGDRVEIRGGRLYVNGTELQEPYTDIRIEDGDRGPFAVEAGRYFVMGDNRHQGASKDSRLFGTVEASMIRGRADWILWPLGQLGNL